MKKYFSIKFAAVLLLCTLFDYLLFVLIFSQLAPSLSSSILENPVISVFIFFWVFLGIPSTTSYYLTFVYGKKGDLGEDKKTRTKQIGVSLITAVICEVIVITSFSLLVKPKFAPYTLVSLDPSELTDPLQFKETNVQTQALSENFKTNSQKIFDSDLSSMSCIPGVGDLSNEKLGLLISDKKLLEMLRNLQSYKFLGNTRDISVSSICKTADRYFILFSTSGDGVIVGGGGYPPVSFAYSDEAGNLSIVENADNCLSFIGSSRDYAYLQCGWGDGPGGWGTISRVKLGESKLIEIVRCNSSVNLSGSVVEKCYNSKHITYYSGKE